MTLHGLFPNTLYNFDVVSAIGTNPAATSANFRFATLSTAPFIANINVIFISDLSATINWTTDQPSTAVVNYGPTSMYGFVSPLISTPSIAHSVTLNGLVPGTAYNFNVVSAGTVGVASTSANQTFTTAPSPTAPLVGFVASYGFTDSSAIFNWSTDVPATTLLAYGTTYALGQFSPVQTTLSTKHGATLTGLNRGTKYYFVAMSTDANGVSGYSPLSSFTTTSPPSLVPVISNVASSNVTSTSATIIWTTDVLSTSQVNYGTTTSYGSSSPLDSTLTSSHSVTLTDLSPGIRYVFQVISASPNGVSTFGADMSGLTVWAWGDSLTVGYGDLTANSYPLYLSTDIGVPVSNQGLGGKTSTEIATAMLATPASFPAGNCNIIWAGANNHNQVSTVLSDISRMVAALSSPKCFLIMGDINDELAPMGTPDYNNVLSTNESLAATYGSNYLNVRELLVQNYNPALALDIASHAQDIPAASLHAVQLHGTITSGALDSTSCAIRVSNGTQGVGTVIVIDAETILINALNDTLDISACTRGYNGTAAASHLANANYSIIDQVHLGSNGYEYIARQVAAWFDSQFPLSFITLNTATQSPVITAVNASNITSTTALISWTTDQSTTSLVNYGPANGNGTATALDPTLNKTHSVLLGGLASNTVYNFDVVSANSAGKSSTSPISSFTTNASLAPAISNVVVANLTATSANITWTTNQPATAQVNYGASPTYGTLSPVTAALTTSHSVTLTGLTPNTAYNFQVTSSNSAGAFSLSGNYTFTTPPASATPPYVGYVAFWGITNTGVIISWSTDVNASTVVAYGTSLALGEFQANNDSLSTISHGIILTGLTPGTKYYFVAQSTGASGATGHSDTYTFTTAGSAPANPGFSLSATPATTPVGSTGNSTVTVIPQTGFNSSVTLAASSWPAGITATFGTNPTTASSIVTITAAATVAPGSYVLTINGTSGALSATTTIPLTVGTAPNFTLTSGAATAVEGSTGTSTVTITPSNGFNSSVTLAASSWPAGITATFGTNPTIASSIVTITVASTVAAGPYSLTVIGTSGTLANSTALALTVMPANTLSSATFTGFDTSTQGTWTGTYGSDGYLFAGGTSSLPSYAKVAFTAASTFTWAGVTSDVRALQTSPGSAARLAACYYSSDASGFTANLTFADGIAHQVALYLLDWDTTTRAQTISISDTATGTLLDSHNVSGFHNGIYEVWNIKGTVTIKFASTGPNNSLASALFFAPVNGTSVLPSFTLNATAASASIASTGNSTVTVMPAGGFNSAVTLAATTWPAGITGTFGTNPTTASSLINIGVAASVAPGLYTLTLTGTSGTLSSNTTIPLTVKAIAQPDFTLSATPATANVGSDVASNITVTPSNGFNSSVTLAASNWPGGITGTFGTSMVTISVASTVAPGFYTLTVTGTGGTLSAYTTIALTVNADSSNLATYASFAGLDVTTQGTWTGKYGADGYLIANGASLIPTYATLGVSNASTYTWAGETTDVRAPQTSPGAATRIASAYTQYANRGFTINLGNTDGKAHKISLYLLDWDTTSRTETITVLDALTNAVLDTQSVSGFNAGQYASWNIKGNITIKVAPNNYSSPAVSAIFFN